MFRRSRQITKLALLIHLAAFVGMPCLAIAADTKPPVSTKTSAEAKALRDKALDYFKKKEYATAVEYYQKALVLERKVGAMAQMASSLKELSRYDEALQWYETALREFPDALPSTVKKITTERDDLLAKVGTISVEGDIVKDAHLFIDNRDVGPLPLQSPIRVLGGLHEVREEKPGFAPIITTVDVTAGKASVAKLVAKKREAKLEIREKHNWILRVEIDGQDAGVSPLSTIITAGDHRIRLHGYMQPDALLLCENPSEPVELGARMQSEEKTIAVGLFETQMVELSAEDMDASLHIDSTPPGATLWIDEHDVGKSPWEGRLPLGEHAIEVRSKGHFVAKQKVTLERRKQRELSISLERVPDPPGFWTGRKVGTTAGLGIGLVGMGLFGVAGGLAFQNASDLQAKCVGGICPGNSAQQLSDTRELGNVALAGMIVGGVGIVAGASIWFFAKPKEQPKDTRERAGLTVQMGLGGVSVGGRF